LYLHSNNELQLRTNIIRTSEDYLGTNQNICITSDEEIKEGDKDFYIIANDRDKTWINRIEKVIECKIDPKHGKVLILSSGFIYIDEGCKIILTTDPQLIADGVQAIDDKFLEWYVKNPSIKWSEVELREIAGLKPKETLEEAFSQYVNEKYHSPTQGSIPDLESARFGTKWQAERMYSEEEVLDLLAKFRRETDFIPFKDILEWFKQFKKK
jgi:hypothetical protein